MTVTLIDSADHEYTIPEVVSWDICHTMGEPCDYYEISALYTSEIKGKLASAVRLRIKHDNATVFFGVVDEYVITLTEKGAVATVHGRSLAALLLDNEAEAAEYVSVGLSTIIAKHVTPCGITNIATGTMNTLAQFSVSSGSSQWSVLKHFCRYAGNIQPRFSPDGKLLLNNPTGSRKSVSDAYSVKYRDNRYGIISTVLVKNRVTGASYTVNNADASNLSARRVITVPKNTGAATARNTAQYQITESQREKKTIELALPRLFAMFPGDSAEIHSTVLNLNGTFTACKTRCWANEQGAGTVVTLEV